MKKPDYKPEDVLNDIVDRNLNSSVMLCNFIGSWSRDWGEHFLELHAQLWAERKCYK